MVKVAIIGAGALGCTLGAWLMRNSQVELSFCVRTGFERLEVQTPEGNLEFRPRLWSTLDEAEQVDWAIVVTKTYDAPGAAKWLEAAAGANTRVAVVQNGVEHLSRFPELNPACVVPVCADIPAERQAPGVVNQRRIGILTVPAGPNGEALRELFKASPIEFRLTNDWATVAWRKLAINCAGAVNALTGHPDRIFAQPDAAGLLRELVTECLAVGRAEGAILPDDLADQVLIALRSGAPDGVNSILADRLAGRPTEADARNGVIARLGRRHGIDAPYNRMADAILRLG